MKVVGEIDAAKGLALSASAAHLSGFTGISALGARWQCQHSGQKQLNSEEGLGL